MSNKFVTPKEMHRQLLASLPETGLRFITIDGVGKGSRGQTVVGGVNVKTGRPCRAVKLTKFIVKA